MSDISRGVRDPREGRGPAERGGPADLYYRKDIPDAEPMLPGDDETVEGPVTPAGEAADAEQADADEVEVPERDEGNKAAKAAEEPPEASEEVGTSPIRRSRGGNDIAQEVVEAERARVFRAQQREATREAQYELAKKRLVQKVHETRDAVSKLREECRRSGKTEDEFEEEAEKMVRVRADEFDHSERMQVMENLLKNVRITNAETAKQKFAFLVGLGMREHMKFWSKDNYMHRFEKKAGRKMESALEDERRQLSMEYDEMDRALAELERESAPEEESSRLAA